MLKVMMGSLSSGWESSLRAWRVSCEHLRVYV